MSDIEKAVLGMALAGGDECWGELQAVTPYDFTDPRHQALWGLIAGMREAGRVVDAPMVLDELPSLPPADRVGVDGAYLVDLMAAAPLAAAVKAHDYVRRLRDGRDRTAQGDLVARLQQVFEATPDPVVFHGEALRLLQEAAPRMLNTGDGVAAEYDDLEATLRQPPKYSPTPWRLMNELLSGWRPGGLYVVGARPGVAKSILGVQAASYAANTGPSLIFSLEMSTREVRARMAAQMGQISMAAMTQSRPMTDSEWHRFQLARQQGMQLPITINPKTDLTINELCAEARRVHKAEGALSCIMVDYLQLISPERGDRRPRHEVVSEISRQLKVIAQELECPVIALSQLNRAGEGRADKKPTLADLRESGSIEQDADVVMLLSMPEVDGMPDQGTLTVNVAKNRHGRMGVFDLERRGEFAELRDKQWSPSV